MRGKYLRPIGSPIKSGGLANDFFPEQGLQVARELCKRLEPFCDRLIVAVSCGLALCEALEAAGIPLTQDQAECKAYIEAWWSVDNPPPGYTPETWAAVERMIAANAYSSDQHQHNEQQ